MTLKPYGRYWAIYDATGVLVCLCVDKKGAQEVVRRLTLTGRPSQEHPMPRPKIVTTITQPDGWTLVLYQQQGVYKVGVLSSHQRPIALQASSYATYGAAHERLMQEAQKRREGHLSTGE